MKFGENLKKTQIELYADFYIDYDFLKDVIRHPKVPYDLFIEAVTIEFKKINSFVNNTHIKKLLTEEQLGNYILLNYIGFYKIFKKYDKKHCHNKKLNFFDLIKKQSFYVYYTMRIPSNNIKLVIFDKDGTLIDNTLMFGNWAIKLVNKLNSIYPKLLELNPHHISIWEHLGYDPLSNVFQGSSVIAKGTNDDIRNSICDYIVNVRKFIKCTTIDDKLAVVERLRQEWFDIEVSKNNIKQCGDIQKIFKFLRMQNIKIAICTSDDRKPTEKTLELLDINTKKGAKIDYLVCGNDMIPSKPSPVPLLTICKKLNVEPKNAMMIGDTISDIHAGINAKFGRIVGVLSGGYNNAELNDADVVIPNIDSLAKIFPDFHCNGRKELRL